MLIHAAYFLTRQTLFQFSIGHVSVLRNERKRKISGHPDNVLAPRKSTQDSSQAVQRLQCQHRPLLLRRSEEHTSELQSHSDLVCRLLLEKKKKELSRKHTRLDTLAALGYLI